MLAALDVSARRGGGLVAESGRRGGSPQRAAGASVAAAWAGRRPAGRRGATSQHQEAARCSPWCRRSATHSALRRLTNASWRAHRTGEVAPQRPRQSQGRVRGELLNYRSWAIPSARRAACQVLRMAAPSRYDRDAAVRPAVLLVDRTLRQKTRCWTSHTPARARRTTLDPVRALVLADRRAGAPARRRGHDVNVALVRTLHLTRATSVYSCTSAYLDTALR